MLGVCEDDLHKCQDGRIRLNTTKLKEQRRLSGMSQEALALHSFELKIYLSIASIKRAESGKAVLYRTAKQFAKLYDIALEELVVAGEGTDFPVSAQTGLPDTASGRQHLLHSTDNSRNTICLTLQIPANVWPQLQADLQARFPALPLSYHVITDGLQLHLLFGSQHASQSNIANSFRYAWALLGSLQQLGTQGQLLLRSAQWYGSTNQLKFHDQREAAGAQWPLPQQATVGKHPRLWIERGLHAGFSRQAHWQDGHSDYLGFLHLTEHCQQCPAFQHMDMGYACVQCQESVDQLTLYGRDRELLLMKMALQEVLQDQSTTVLYIRGVAGVGKSRLIEEFIGTAREHELRCHHCWVSDSQHEFQQSLLAQLLFNALEIPLSGRYSHQLAQTALDRLHLSALQKTALMLLMKLNPDSEDPLYTALSLTARDTLKLEAVASVLMQLSIQQPLLLVIEDVHWASQLDLDALASLLTLTQAAPLIWLLSSRHEQDPLEQHLRHSIVDLSFTLLDLSPLRAADARQLAAQFAGIDAEYREQCIQHANGNPLFLTQLLLSRRMDSLPATLAHLVQSKLDVLSSLDRLVLRYASVAGRQVSLAQMQAVLGIDSYSFAPLIQYYLMRAQGQDYVFVHHLIAMSIYDALEETQRINLHLSWAEYYQGCDTASSAFHFHKASDARAIAQYLLAIQDNYGRLAYQEAWQLVEQALSMQASQSQPEENYRLHVLAAQTANKLGLTRQARQYYQQAMQLAPSQKQQLTAAIGLIRTLNVLEERQAELALLEQLMPQAEAQQDTELLAQLYNIKGNLSFFLGDIAACKTCHEQAIQYAEACGLQEIRVRSFGGLGDASYAQGHMQTAQEHLSRSIVLAREYQLLEIETANLFMLATVKIYANDTQAALQDAVTAAGLSRRVGNRRAEVVSRLTAGWILLSLCQYAQAREQVEQGLQLARAMGAIRFEAFLLESLARLAWAEGQSEAAAQHIAQAWQIVQQLTCDAFIGPWVLGTKVLLGATDEAGQQQAAQDVSIAMAILDKGCVGHNYYRCYVALAEYYLMCQQPQQARDYIGRLQQYTAQQPCGWSAHFIQLVHAYADWLQAADDVARVQAMQVWKGCFARGVELGLGGVTPRLLVVYQRGG